MIPVEQQILTIVKRRKGITAKEIAVLLSLTRNEVNSVLYRLKGEGKCSIDSLHRWTCGEKSSAFSSIISQNTVHESTSKTETKESTSVLTARNTTYSKDKPLSVSTQTLSNSHVVLTTPVQKSAVRTEIKKSISESVSRGTKKSKGKSSSTCLQTRTKMKIPCNVPYSPDSSKAEDLFEYAVKHLALRSQDKDDVFAPKMHNQWYNCCFGYSGIRSDIRSEYMSAIKSKYGAYFIGKAKYTFDIETIERDFPQFFADYKADDLDPIDEILRAVKSELEFAAKPQNKNKYKVNSIEREKGTPNIYRILLDLKDDDEPNFYEGAKITLLANGKYYECIGLDYDIATTELSVSCDVTLPCRKNIYGQITLDTTFILEAVYESVKRLEQGSFQDQPIDKFLSDETDKLEDFNVNSLLYEPYMRNLDASQKEAFIATINHDITFIWGPPGTGKSYTLAAIIRALFALSDSTAVCCISNVAVDQLLNKVVDLLDNEGYNPGTGNFYRAGHTIDQRLINTNYLFPEDSETTSLRNQISSINRRLEILQSTKKMHADDAEILQLKNRRVEVKEALEKHTKYLVNNSKVVFSTISNFILSKQLLERKFDNLIVDEVSMLSIPYLLAIAQRIAKRIILVGDPKQLGPISISPHEWLSENVFDYYEVSTKGHPALKRLLNQRRSHPDVVGLINDIFYNGKLQTEQKESPVWVQKGPFPGKTVVVINSGIEENEVKHVGSTRRNFGTKAVVMSILNDYSHYVKQSLSIGVITPYRGQVKMYKAALKDNFVGDGFWESIKVGTIHTFQGSECDLIILDIVEENSTRVSKLFNHVDGERLINVALSRAKHKLIVVGDTKRFAGGAGIANVSDKVIKVFNKLGGYSWKQV